MATVPTSRRRRPADGPKPAVHDFSPPVTSLCIPVSAMTLDGFHAWVESDEFPETGLRTVFIGKEIYLDMSEEDLDTHSLVKAAIYLVLLMLNRDLKLGFLFVDGVRVSNEDVELSSKPDAVLVKQSSLRSGRVRLVPRQNDPTRFKRIDGTPDWLMEIVSDSSVRKDTMRLRETYHRAGIPEYWLIDARGDEIDFQILYWRAKGYVAAPTREGWQRSKVFGRSFRLERQRNALGMWEYTLHMRAD
jgi:Uma2 family endonuclease